MGRNMGILVENGLFSLRLDGRCRAESLILKATGEELLASGEGLPLFSLTEERPYNNEIKLAHPTQRTVFQANRVRREGNLLIVGFQLIAFEAVVEVLEREKYILFRLVDFIVKPEHFAGLAMTPPPVSEFRLLQLPLRDRERFGQWLNVLWDDTAAAAVLGTSPHTRITCEEGHGCRVLCADAVRGIKLRGCAAALAVSETRGFLNCVEALEEDFDLPRGVASRRSPWLNRSVYWSGHVTPKTVDRHIAWAKKGGFQLMLLNYYAIVRSQSYEYCGDYDLLEDYPKGLSDLKAMLDKIKAAGILPGFHFLHTHIGRRSRYMAPVADHRLHLTRHFTLARPLGAEDTVVYVEENPEDSVMEPRCRVLKFGGELISYEAFSTEPPYRFTGCGRGHWETHVTEHALGTIGGLLDVSEYLAGSVYLDQNSSLQDEIARKIGDIYNTGFQFAYFDGSEGTNAPFGFHVPNAQYRVYSRFAEPPIFAEGAAKAHFSWHMLSGGNAFDAFPPEVFKENIARFPMEEAERMRNDFTRVNFGWWQFSPDIQPDLYEYGTSRAAAFDCPATVLTNMEAFEANPRTEDILEVMRRWEDVRRKNWLTPQQKEMLKDPSQEHILLINEKGDYELVPYRQLPGAAGGSGAIRAFCFERMGRSYAVAWATKEDTVLELALEDVLAEKELGGKRLPVEIKDGKARIPVSGRCYLSIDGSGERLRTALEQATAGIGGRTV